MTDYFFCPGTWAIGNISSYRGTAINTYGNTLFDSLRISESFAEKIVPPPYPFAVVTIHRYENIFHRDQLAKIVSIIERVTKKIPILFILHPPTKKNLIKFDFYDRLQANSQIELKPRYDYFRFISLLKHAEFVISDGGSNQEECYYLGKPCLLLRYASERQEGLGTNVVLSCFDDKLIDQFVEKYTQYQNNPVAAEISPSRLIVDTLLEKGFC